MKKTTSIVPALRAFCVLFLFLLAYSSIGQSLEPKCYVVVGVFKMKSNAEYYTELMKGRQYEAQHKLNTHKQLYYVYVFESLDRSLAKQKLFEVREEYNDLKKAWLYAGDFKSAHIAEQDWKQQSQVRQESLEIVEDVAEPSIAPEIETASIEEEEVSEEVLEEETEEEDTEPSWKIYINTVNAASFNEVNGKFLLFDAERNQQIREVKTHELVKVEDPNNRTNRVRVVSDIFGFHEIEHTFDMDEPLKSNNDAIADVQGDSIILNFKMQRLRQGDVATLWKVYFYKDAAIMREESIYELNQLLDLLKENENIEVAIHGHTNGNSHGKVLHLDMDDKQFFSLNGSHEETMASAKKLSLFRAHTIKHWLMDQGIAENRMETKGWGGKKMIYDKFDTQADKNVRVEIEITKE